MDHKTATFSDFVDGLVEAVKEWCDLDTKHVQKREEARIRMVGRAAAIKAAHAAMLGGATSLAVSVTKVAPPALATAILSGMETTMVGDVLSMQRDAARWRALIGAERITYIGDGPNVLCLEVWKTHPDQNNIDGRNAGRLLDFVEQMRGAGENVLNRALRMPQDIQVALEYYCANLNNPVARERTYNALITVINSYIMSRDKTWKCALCDKEGMGMPTSAHKGCAACAKDRIGPWAPEVKQDEILTYGKSFKIGDKVYFDDPDDWKTPMPGVIVSLGDEDHYKLGSCINARIWVDDSDEGYVVKRILRPRRSTQPGEGWVEKEV